MKKLLGSMGDEVFNRLKRTFSGLSFIQSKTFSISGATLMNSDDNIVFSSVSVLTFLTHNDARLL